MKNLTPEMIEKAKSVNSAEELLALAKENNIEMTADEAATYFAQLNPKSGELDDDDLDNVAGGACEKALDVGTNIRVTSGQICPKCGANVGHIQPDNSVICGKCKKDIIVDNYVLCTYELIG